MSLVVGTTGSNIAEPPYSDAVTPGVAQRFCQAMHAAFEAASQTPWDFTDHLAALGIGQFVLDALHDLKLDHDQLDGLDDDDHEQYYNQVRGDARYSQIGHNHDAAYAAASHGADHVSTGDDPIAAATSSVGGLMAAADKARVDELRLARNRVGDVGNGSSMYSHNNYAGAANSTFCGWRVWFGREGQNYRYHMFEVARWYPQYNTTSGRYRLTGVAVDAAGVASLMAGAIGAPGTSDVTIYSDALITVAITGSSSGQSDRLKITNNSGGYADICIMALEAMGAV